MSYLRTLLSDKSKSAVLGMGCSECFFTQAWPLPNLKFDRPRVFAATQLEVFFKQKLIKDHNKKALNDTQ